VISSISLFICALVGDDDDECRCVDFDLDLELIKVLFIAVSSSIGNDDECKRVNVSIVYSNYFFYR